VGSSHTTGFLTVQGVSGLGDSQNPLCMAYMAAKLMYTKSTYSEFFFFFFRCDEYF